MREKTISGMMVSTSSKDTKAIKQKSVTDIAVQTATAMKSVTDIAVQTATAMKSVTDIAVQTATAMAMGKPLPVSDVVRLADK